MPPSPWESRIFDAINGLSHKMDQMRIDISALYTRMDEIQGEVRQEFTYLKTYVSRLEEKLEYVQMAQEYGWDSD